MDRREIIERNLRNPGNRKTIRTCSWWLTGLGCYSAVTGGRWLGFGIAVLATLLLIAEDTLADRWLARRDRLTQATTGKENSDGE